MAKTSEVSVGSVFGQLTVAGIGANQGSHRKVLCYCDCGKFLTVTLSNLGTKTSGCGCQRNVKAGKAIATHGGRQLPEYSIWCDMWKRCTNPNNKRYAKYQYRRPADTWLKFENFYKDMGPRPSNEHSLDRIDNSKGYSPENCRWATVKEQMQNRPEVKLFSYRGGPSLTLEDVHKLTGKNEATLRHRLKQQGLSPENAIGSGWQQVQGPTDWQEKPPD